MTLTHIPEDMTATVDAPVTLAALQTELARRGQWVPVDPPGAPTLRELLDANASGPRRYAFGTVRDHVLGLRVRLADGRLIRCGGNVVKNVAGYDLCRLFVGARGALGEITEVTFKLRPLPEKEAIVQRQCGSLREAGQVVDTVLASAVTPVVLDLVAPATVVVGFAGTGAEVAWQLEQLGWSEPATLDYNQPLPRRVSVLPSRLIDTLETLGAETFVSRAGNGSIHYRGGSAPPPPELPAALFERLKAAFDPTRQLPAL